MFQILLLHFSLYVLKYYHNIVLEVFSSSIRNCFMHGKGVEVFE